MLGQLQTSILSLSSSSSSSPLFHLATLPLFCPTPTPDSLRPASRCLAPSGRAARQPAGERAPKTEPKTELETGRNSGQSQTRAASNRATILVIPKTGRRRVGGAISACWRPNVLMLKPKPQAPSPIGSAGVQFAPPSAPLSPSDQPLGLAAAAARTDTRAGERALVVLGAHSATLSTDTRAP